MKLMTNLFAILLEKGQSESNVLSAVIKVAEVTTRECKYLSVS